MPKQDPSGHKKLGGHRSDDSQATGPTKDKPDSVQSEVRTATWDIRFASNEYEDGDPLASPDELNNRYLLRTCLNVGGCGEIWEALQVSLNRIVAVKRVHFSADTDRRKIDWLRWQFRQEALITARLDHPNILPVHDLGMDASGTPVLAMKLVRGTPWTARIRRDFESMTWEDFLETQISILIEVCNAVDFAHSRGVVHRDLKPSQVMVGEFGEVLLMDWGLAVYVGDNPDEATQELLDVDLPTPLTAVSPAGTPNMMAPEQTEPTADNISPATDIYLLGGILYFILTGTYPHSGRTGDESMAAARMGMIDPLEKRAPDRNIPDELRTLALSCLSRRMSDRVASARLVRQRLRDFQRASNNQRESHQFVDQAAHLLDKIVEEKQSTSSANVSQLRPGAEQGSMPRVYERLHESLAMLDRARGSWLRNPRIPALEVRAITAYADAALKQKDYTLARVMCARLNDPSLAGELSRRIDAQQDRDRRNVQNRKRMLAATGTVALGLGIATIVYAWKLQDVNTELAGQHQLANTRLDSMLEAERVASTQRAIAEEALARAERLQYYSGIGYAASAFEQLRGETSRITLTTDLPIEYRNWEWGMLMGLLHPEAAMLQNSTQMFHAGFSHDGSRIATGDTRFVSLYDANDARMIWRTEIGRGVVWSVQFNADDSRIVAATFDREAVVLDAATGEVLVRTGSHDEILRDAALTPDGRWILTAARDGKMRRFDAETGELAEVYDQHTASLYTLRFSPDHRHFATSSFDRTVVIWDADTFEAVHVLSQGTANLMSAHFSPDSSRIAATDADGYLRVFDVASGERIHEIKAPEDYLHHAVFSHDGSMLFSAGDTGMLRAWDAESGELLTSLYVDNPIWKLSTSPAGRWMVATTRRSVRLIDLDAVTARSTVIPLADHAEDFHTADRLKVFSSTETRLPTWRMRDQVWTDKGGLTMLEKSGRRFLVETGFSALSADRSMFATVDRSVGQGRITSTSTGDTLFESEEGLDILDFVFSRDGNRVAIRHESDIVHVIDTATWETIHTIDVREHIVREFDDSISIDAVDFDPFSRYLGIVAFRHSLLVFDLESGELAHDFGSRHGMAFALAFSPDGRYVATGDNNDTLFKYDLETGNLVARFVGHPRPVFQMTFNDDGTRLLTLGSDGYVKLWDALTGRELVNVIDSSEFLPLGISFSRDGDSVLVAGQDGQVVVKKALPWEPSVFESMPGASFNEQLEMYLRRTRLNPDAVIEDLAVAEPSGNADAVASGQ